ncbi:hypothetical protein GUITHDRAFT_113675 [Guillardia theta CCMP2712]|uniref:Uncharacterized protein n=2 Tax=Guillardia theta TaxID=55529 RepID=L1IWI1_GUITC|nr:hypothetical protein GUITHDRAFT_113675 [Guillardia theta CCMP2712]EKX40195.1 hypothetical protein GUITHDRAFT_113675 [Guillardia theta CCMP2712]|eukprot:XP_005827175.1 hypothetical protein GUITHDRAFT_113675 [Guillardia theta CCMP2712]
MGIGMDSIVQAASAGAGRNTKFLGKVFHVPIHDDVRLNAGADEDGVAYKGAGDVIRKQLKKKGLRGFYKGIQVKLIQDVVRSVSFFYVFAVLKGFYSKQFGRIGLRANLLLGYLSATMNLLLTMPIEVANTRQMTGVSSGGFLAILAELVQKKGFSGLYTGILTNFILCLNPAIKHMVFDQVKARILKGRRALSAMQSFFLGAVATAIASTATFPAARVRAILQSSSLTEVKREKWIAVHILREIIRKDGFSSLYKGLGPQLMKGVLSSALLLATKEKIHHQVDQVVRVLLLVLLFFLGKSKHKTLPRVSGKM